MWPCSNHLACVNAITVTALCGRYSYYPHFIEEETEVQACSTLAKLRQLLSGGAGAQTRGLAPVSILLTIGSSLSRDRGTQKGWGELDETPERSLLFSTLEAFPGKQSATDKSAPISSEPGMGMLTPAGGSQGDYSHHRSMVHVPSM